MKNKIYSDMKKQMTPPDELVEKVLSQPVRKPARKPVWFVLAPVGVCAAALALALIGPRLGLPVDTTAPADTTTQPYYSTTTPAETHIVRRWEDMSDLERYTMLNFDGKRYEVSFYFSPERKVTNSGLYTLLGSATASGYDGYAETTRYLDVEVYAITGISTKCAVAVKFPGDDIAYNYQNSEYAPATLGELIDDLSLRENLKFGNIYYTFTEGYVRHEVEYSLADAEKIWNMLLSDRTLEMLNPEYYQSAAMSISIDIELAGVRNMSLAVTNDGYLQTDLFNNPKVCFIGKDKVNAFINYVRENATVVKSNAYPFDNPNVPGTTIISGVPHTTYPSATEITSPAYNPQMQVATTCGPKD